MILHGHTPRDLLASTIISIPKDMRASLCKSDNYRGISLINAICKVFDYETMYLCDDFVYTSEMQFGFKQNYSTVLCSLMYNEVVSNYLQNGSNVYSCLLDASKAFDRINFGKLFAILIESNVPLCFIRLILDAYTSSSLVCHGIIVFRNIFLFLRGEARRCSITYIIFYLYRQVIIKIK